MSSQPVLMDWDYGAPTSAEPARVPTPRAEGVGSAFVTLPVATLCGLN
ncbi:MAG: hypothetical protein LC114_01365 [Bryobacterales bacterium]|nr:hypothetical protein [Bryobacterales bacterium]